MEINEKREIISNFIDETLREIPNALNAYVSDDNGKFSKRREFNEITQYINNFLEGKKRKRFILLPGIRGVGKTTLLFQVYEYLLKEINVNPDQIIYISCDDLNDLCDCTIREFTEIFLEDYHDTTMRQLDKNIFLLIDETQYDKKWTTSSKVLFDRSKNIFILITGSSALTIEDNADIERRSVNKEILPLSFSHHLELKYKIQIKEKQDILTNFIITGEIKEIIERELELNNTLMNNSNYTNLDWKNYLYYGGFPVYFEEEDTKSICNDIVKMTRRVVKEDISNMKNISEDNKTNANRILRYLSMIDSADVSMNKISKYLNTAVGNVETILGLLEKTHLIYHLEPYGSPSLRTRKARKYYFTTSSIKYALSSKIGNNIKDKNKFEGLLIENMVASKLFKLTADYDDLTLFYDSNNNGNVDFIVKEEFGKIIPIEVGKNKKNTKQIENAIKHYKAEYGIIISDNRKKIEKKGNIIHIPIKIFALL
ncbi:MAG: ATP-binding protein [Methanosphaera stadtmanae]|nr:ATP-binding protein [Methanosphaera stadtmanae]